jgi:hypothetical protein
MRMAARHPAPATGQSGRQRHRHLRSNELFRDWPTSAPSWWDAQACWSWS